MKDALGREIDPNSPTGRMMNTYQGAVSGVPQAVGRGARAVSDAVGSTAQTMGARVNALPKLWGTPMAAVANAGAKVGADFMTGFTGQKYVPNQYEGKTFTQMFGGAPAPTLTAPTAITKPSVSATPGAPKPISVPVTNPGGANRTWVEDTTSPFAEFRAAQYARDGLGATNYTGPTSIAVSRQPNGVLSFTGTGVPGAQGIRYTGTPNWTSQRGGAGQGGVTTFGPGQGGGSGFNLSEQNARMAAALQGIREIDAQNKQAELVDRIASGSGGAIGVAQNKIALAGLNSMADTNSRARTAMDVAGINAETQRRAQDLGMQAATMRNLTTLAGYKSQADTAKNAQEIEKERIGLMQSIAKQKMAGDPLKQQAAQMDFMLKYGQDPITGKNLDPKVHEQMIYNANRLKFGFAPPGGMVDTNEEQ